MIQPANISLRGTAQRAFGFVADLLLFRGALLPLDKMIPIYSDGNRPGNLPGVKQALTYAR